LFRSHEELRSAALMEHFDGAGRPTRSSGALVG